MNLHAPGLLLPVSQSVPDLICDIWLLLFQLNPEFTLSMPFINALIVLQSGPVRPEASLILQMENLYLLFTASLSTALMLRYAYNL